MPKRFPPSLVHSAQLHYSFSTSSPPKINFFYPMYHSAGHLMCIWLAASLHRAPFALCRKNCLNNGTPALTLMFSFILPTRNCCKVPAVSVFFQRVKMLARIRKPIVGVRMRLYTYKNHTRRVGHLICWFSKKYGSGH